MPLNPARAKELVVALEKAREPGALAVAADMALNFLLKQLEELRELANGYPRNPISGDVWMDGQALTFVCDALTEALAGRSEPERQELASRLAAGMACQVMAHYPEEIFPRVVRNGRCRESLRQIDVAMGSYEAVVADFSSLGLDEMLDESGPLEDSERRILGAVCEAIERLSALQPERATQHEGLLRRARLRMGTAAP